MLLDATTLSQFDEWLAEAQSSGGVALIDKQKGWTSFDVIAKMRGITRIKKTGHAGTLDPLATGLLIVCCGRAATKTIDTYQAQRKEYRTVVKLGATTKTDDAEGEEENILPTDGILLKDIEEVLKDFQGEISQVPPMYSAIKKDGVPMYKLARKDITVEIAPRNITIYSLKIIEFNSPFITLDVECSKGTYIRSLARDIGKALGCGGFMADLRRTAIGEYRVENAVTIDQIRQQMLLKTESI
ncbi:MAG: tRNA pseudouridine(55) synthase TruB [Bacteroidota bacterium]